MVFDQVLQNTSKTVIVLTATVENFWFSKSCVLKPYLLVLRSLGHQYVGVDSNWVLSRCDEGCDLLPYIVARVALSAGLLSAAVYRH